MASKLARFLETVSLTAEEHQYSGLFLSPSDYPHQVKIMGAGAPLPSGSGAKPAMKGLKDHNDQVVAKPKYDENGMLIPPIRKSTDSVKKSEISPAGSRAPRSPPLTPKAKILADLLKGKTTEDIQKLYGKAIVSPRTQIRLEKEQVQVEQDRVRHVQEQRDAIKEILSLTADHPLLAGEGISDEKGLESLEALKTHIDELINKLKPEEKPESPVTPTHMPLDEYQKAMLAIDKVEGKKQLREILDRIPVTPRTKLQLTKTRAEYLEKIAITKANYPNILDNEDVDPENYKLPAYFNTFPEQPDVFGKATKNPNRHSRKIVHKQKGNRPTQAYQKSSIVLEDHTEVPVKEVGTWAITQLHLREDIRPGTVIRAQHAVSNNDMRTSCPDDHVRMFAGGPVFAKWRPYIVLWRLSDYLICVPLFSYSVKDTEGHSEIGLGLEQFDFPYKRERLEEFVPIMRSDNEGKKWRGYRLALKNGPPLIVKPLSKNYQMSVGCFADIARTVSISRYDYYEDNLAQLTDASFARLLEIVRYREQVARDDALLKRSLRDTNTASPPALQRMGDDRTKWQQMGVADDQIDQDDAYYDADYIDLNR